MFRMQSVFFWEFPRRLKFKSRRFGTQCRFHRPDLPDRPGRWNRHWVPKCRLLNFRRRGNSQKNTDCILNTAKVLKLPCNWLVYTQISPSHIWTTLYMSKHNLYLCTYAQGDSNMTGTVTGLFTHKSVPVIFEPLCICQNTTYIYVRMHKVIQIWPGL